MKIPTPPLIENETLHFSCKELAEMKLPGKPGTRQGWDVIVNAEKWPYIEVASRGRKGKTKKYHPPAALMQLINWQYPEGYIAPSHYTTGSGNAKRHVVNDYLVDASKVARYNRPSYHYESLDEYLVESIDFNPASNQLEAPFQHLKIFTIRGTSLEPSMHDGDEVLVDMRCRAFDDNAVYVIGQNDFIRIKRVQLRLDGAVVVRNDNDGDLPPEIYTAEEAKGFNVIGKVIPFKFGRFKL